MHPISWLLMYLTLSSLEYIRFSNPNQGVIKSLVSIELNFFCFVFSFGIFIFQAMIYENHIHCWVSQHCLVFLNGHEEVHTQCIYRRQIEMPCRWEVAFPTIFDMSMSFEDLDNLITNGEFAFTFIRLHNFLVAFRGTMYHMSLIFFLSLDSSFMGSARVVNHEPLDKQLQIVILF